MNVESLEQVSYSAPLSLPSRLNIRRNDIRGLRRWEKVKIRCVRWGRFLRGAIVSPPFPELPPPPQPRRTGSKFFTLYLAPQARKFNPLSAPIYPRRAEIAYRIVPRTRSTAEPPLRRIFHAHLEDIQYRRLNIFPEIQRRWMCVDILSSK